LKGEGLKELIAELARVKTDIQKVEVKIQ
jgi:hypothetical protein